MNSLAFIQELADDARRAGLLMFVDVDNKLLVMPKKVLRKHPKLHERIKLNADSLKTWLKALARQTSREI